MNKHGMILAGNCSKFPALVLFRHKHNPVRYPATNSCPCAVRFSRLKLVFRTGHTFLFFPSPTYFDNLCKGIQGKCFRGAFALRLADTGWNDCCAIVFGNLLVPQLAGDAKAWIRGVPDQDARRDGAGYIATRDTDFVEAGINNDCSADVRYPADVLKLFEQSE